MAPLSSARHIGQQRDRGRELPLADRAANKRKDLFRTYAFQIYGSVRSAPAFIGSGLLNRPSAPREIPCIEIIHSRLAVKTSPCEVRGNPVIYAELGVASGPAARSLLSEWQVIMPCHHAPFRSVTNPYHKQ